MSTKLVYLDGDSTKVLWGKVISEDEVFVHFQTDNEFYFRLNKKQIISIKGCVKDGF